MLNNEKTKGCKKKKKKKKRGRGEREEGEKRERRGREEGEKREAGLDQKRGKAQRKLHREGKHECCNLGSTPPFQNYTNL